MKKEIANQEKEMTTMAGMGEFQPVDEQDTIRIPRLVLVQGGRNNPLIKEGVAKDGDLINSLSKENYGNSIEIIPLAQKKSTRIRWGSRDEGGGMLCIARDGITGAGDPGDTLPGNACTRCMFFKDQHAKTGCTSNYEIVAMVRHTREAILLTAGSIKPSDAGIRDLLGNARTQANKGIRMFQKSYILKVVDAKSKENEFYKIQCLPGNDNALLPDTELGFLQKQSEFFKTSTLKADEVEQPAQAGATGAPKDW